MKRFLLLLLLLASAELYSQTITADNATSIGTTSATLNGTYDPTGYDLVTSFQVIVDDNSDFGSPVINWTAANNSEPNITYSATGLRFGTTYYFKFKATFYIFSPFSQTTVESASASFSTNNITQTSDIVFSGIQSNSITASYTAGTGGNRIVLVKEGSAVDSDPVDGTQYTSNTIFGSGDQIGTGNYVVAKGDNDNVIVTGLQEGLTYHFKVYEYLIDGTYRDYRTDGFPAGNNPNSQATLKPEPTTQASNINFTSVGSSSVGASWTAGNGDGRMVVVRADGTSEVNPSDNTDYTANTDIGSSGTTGVGNYVVYKGTGTSVSVTGLSAETRYHFKVYEYNNSGALTNYKIDGYPAGTNPDDTITLKGQPTQASNLVFSNIANTTLTVDWTTGDGEGAVLIAREGSSISDFPIDGSTYTANLAFGSGSNLGNNTYVLYSGSGTSANITGLTIGTTYYFMVCESNNSGANTDYNTNPAANNPLSQSTLKAAPATQASNITFSSIQANQMTINWTSGSGDNRIVLVKQSSVVNGVPSDGTTYTANTVFGSGDQIGTGNYVVYNGSSNSVTVTNLLANTAYYVKIFEYNNTGANILFKTDGFGTGNPADTITPKGAPTIQSTQLVFSNILTDGMTLDWTRGNGDSVLIVAKVGTTLPETPTDGSAYTDNTVFGSGETIATGVYAVYTGTGTTVTVSGLSSNTEYVFKAFEFNNGEPYTGYLTSDDTNNPLTQSTTGTEPTVQASNILFTNTGSTQTDVSWTAGTGGTGRIVLCKSGTAVDSNPVDGITYTADTAFGSGSQLGSGNYVVAVGDVAGITLTSLTPEIEYHLKVFEYSGSGGSINYLLPDGTDNPDSVTTLMGKPVTQASNVTFTNLSSTGYRVGWTRGSGQNVLVVGVAGSFTAGENPVDVTTYTADTVFGSGTAIGSGYVVYNGNTPDYVDVTNLTPNTNYSFKVFEYNTPVTDPYYQTNDGTTNPSSRSSLATEPTSQTSAISFSSVGSTQATLSWTSGDGSNRIVIAHEATDIVTDPSDGAGYTDNSVFATGDEIGTGHYVVYNGVGTGVTVTGLNPNTTYYFRAYEYNGTATSCNYLTSSGASSNTTTIKTEPTVQASAITFSSQASTNYSVSWTRGDAVNNDGVILLAHQGAPVDQFPSDGSYGQVANSIFGGGTEIGTGNFVVYKGTGTSVIVTGLTQNNEYHFRAFEYNNTGSNTDYLTTTATGNPSSSFTLDSVPTIQASGFSVTLAGSSSLTLGFTSGSGTGRIILAKQGSAVNGAPVNTTTYSANAAFGSGSEIGTGNFVVYAGTGTSVEVTGLLASTQYYFQIFEYNNTGLINYRTSDGPATNGTTGEKLEPTVPASAIGFTSVGTTSFTINWTIGDGEGRIVAMRETDQGTIENPKEDTTYNASTDWTSKGRQLGTSGYYTVYNGTGNSVSVTNLGANKTYWVQVFEYNNPSGFEKYLTTTATGNPSSQSTLKLAPTMQAANISTTATTSNSISLTWDVGNGDNRICAINTTSSFSGYNGTDPTANTVYGSGEQVIYNGSSNSVTVTGLIAGTTYYFKVLEYNNTGANTLYHSSDTTNNPNNFNTLGTATWDGSSSNDWGTADNWTPSGVPGSGQSVIIATGAANYPVISSGYSVDYLTIEPAANLTINDGGSMTVTNNLLLQSPSGSGANGAVVIPGTGSLNVGGTSTLERYISSGNWHLVSYPISGPAISLFTGYYANAYDEVNAAWEHLTTASSVGVMQGISVLQGSGSNMISFAGSLNNGNQNINVINSSPGDDSFGWNLVGNPYPCTIDWDAESGWSLTNVDPTAYSYNSGSGSYSTWSSATGTGTGSGSPYITSAQGFFVHASGNGSLAMTNEVRVPNTQSFQKTANAEKQLIRIESTNDQFSNDAVLLFFADATDNYDSNYDALKLLATNEDMPEVYFVNNESYLAIDTYHENKLLELTTTNQLIFSMGATPGSTGNVMFKMSEVSGIPNDVYIYLYDALNQTYTNLRTKEYECHLSNDVDDRFQLVLTKNAVSVPEEKLDLNIWTYTKEKTIFIKSSKIFVNQTSVYLYDIAGRLVGNIEMINTDNQSIDVLSSGTYILKFIVGNQIATQKVVVE
ncbi:MAG: hypothetical protein A2W95_00945 [Bacteroidetes bacterium GWA2_40_14]|nr:MAG: hypothetical protein A2W95_00945 [Bacteroidetes bacterium GWA2_40_14]